MDIQTRRGFLNLAAVFEGGALLLGLLLGWATGTFRADSLTLDLPSAGWGAAAVIPMLGVILLAPDLRRQVRELLGQSLHACRWYDLAALALLAGIGEELLFRGVLQGWIGRWNAWGGLVAANLLFGLAHAVTPRYFLFATLIGVYFSWLHAGWPGTPSPLGPPNLLRPMIAHALYDFVAFQVIVHDYRRLGPGGRREELDE